MRRQTWSRRQFCLGSFEYVSLPDLSSRPTQSRMRSCFGKWFIDGQWRISAAAWVLNEFLSEVARDEGEEWVTEEVSEEGAEEKVSNREFLQKSESTQSPGYLQSFKTLGAEQVTAKHAASSGFIQTWRKARFGTKTLTPTCMQTILMKHVGQERSSQERSRESRRSVFSSPVIFQLKPHKLTIPPKAVAGPSRVGRGKTSLVIRFAPSPPAQRNLAGSQAQHCSP